MSKAYDGAKTGDDTIIYPPRVMIHNRDEL